jgi:hypothetical protein
VFLEERKRFLKIVKDQQVKVFLILLDIFYLPYLAIPSWAGNPTRSMYFFFKVRAQHFNLNHQPDQSPPLKCFREIHYRYFPEGIY